jgi:hypothetical protein
LFLLKMATMTGGGTTTTTRSVLSEILEVVLNGMGVGEEKVKEIVSLAEAQERALPSDRLETQTQSTLEILLKGHLQGLFERQELTRKVLLLQTLARGFIVRRRVEQLTGVTRFVATDPHQAPPWTTGKIWKRLTAVKDLITSERMFVDLMTAMKVSFVFFPFPFVFLPPSISSHQSLS